jgi:hypothetical protein
VLHLPHERVALVTLSGMAACFGGLLSSPAMSALLLLELARQGASVCLWSQVLSPLLLARHGTSFSLSVCGSGWAPDDILNRLMKTSIKSNTLLSVHLAVRLCSRILV